MHEHENPRHHNGKFQSKVMRLGSINVLYPLSAHVRNHPSYFWICESAHPCDFDIFMNLEEQFHHVELLFQVLGHKDLKEKMKRSFSMQTGIILLGHTVGEYGTHSDLERSSKIQKYPFTEA